jgi:cobalt transporter subunit CbtB
MNTISISKSSATVASHERALALKAAFVALVLGFSVLYVAGFSSTEQAHNAGHDYRHAMSFPCH